MTAKISRASMTLLLLIPLCAYGAANVQVFNFDDPGEGFNDPTPAEPVGGNPGTTVGQQRQIAFLRAAQIWGATLTSPQIIRIAAFFDPLPCTATAGVLGGAAPFNAFADVPGLPPGVWYPAALAEKITNINIGESTGFDYEVFAEFNSSVGQAGCLTGSSWYYGLNDDTPPGQLNLLTVLLHEFGHGFGFTVGPTDPSTGARPLDYRSVWEQFVKDLSTGKRWVDMTGAEIVSSAVKTNNLVWIGPHVRINTPVVLGFRTELLVIGQNNLKGPYEAQPAAFGPPLTQTGIADLLTPAIDTGGPSPIDGCEPLDPSRANSVKGRIALIDRGTCPFTQKVKNAQLAGAVGVVIANDVPGGLPGMGGSDPTITIPSIGITQELGHAIRETGRTGILVNMRLSRLIRAGTTDGFARLYAPDPFEPGSSVSHWDVSMSPNQLMEPFINSDLSLRVTAPRDLTFSLLRDIGW